jgi:hypothetical protein
MRHALSAVDTQVRAPLTELAVELDCESALMAGYTPVFDTVLDGTLFGKWPHTGIWVCLLSQCDRRGHIDVVPALIAAKIGVPVELLLSCISDFMKPDPGSRTGDLEGRRLELIDPASREWGWKVINHATYREKARKSAYDKDRTESGRDAERKRKTSTPAKSREVPRSPDTSRAVPLSEAEANNKKVAAAPDPIPGLDLDTWNRWILYRTQIKKPIKPPSMQAAMRELASYGDMQAAVVEQSIANSYQGLFALKTHGAAQAKTPGGRFKTA